MSTRICIPGTACKKTAGGSDANHIARWNRSEWSTLSSGMDRSVAALALAGSDLYAGGVTRTGGKVSLNATKAIAIPGAWLRVRQGLPGPGSSTFKYVGVPNVQCLVRFATNLSTRAWFTLATNIVAPNGHGTVLESRATNAQHFYPISARRDAE